MRIPVPERSREFFSGFSLAKLDYLVSQVNEQLNMLKAEIKQALEISVLDERVVRTLVVQEVSFFGGAVSARTIDSRQAQNSGEGQVLR